VQRCQGTKANTEPEKKEPLGLLADEDAGLEATGELANCGRFSSETPAWKRIETACEVVGERWTGGGL
jgi:hypothetical protein